MNKTVNMNLGGFFFHIDEDAYQKLNRYFDAIKRSLSSEGREEIMNDIESRISELFSEKLTNDKQVLGMKDVDDVIAVMGQPEDYKIEDNDPKDAGLAYTRSGSKKLYRDRDNGILGGVAAGLGHYFGIDTVWIRILFIISPFISFGTSIIIYIILWIITPEALTTSEKLEMRGEPITISNIEKKVKEEFESVSEKFKNADYGKLGNQVKYGAGRVGNSLGDVLISIFKVFAKFIGAIMVLISSLFIICLLFSTFTLGSTSFMHVPWLDYFNAFNYTNTSLWLISLLFFLGIGIPLFFFLILGLKILVTNMKSIGNVAKYTLLAVWILAVASLTILAVRQSTEIASTNKVVKKETINIKPTDTLFVKFRFNDYYTKSIHNREDFEFVQDSANNNFIYSNNVTIEMMPTEEKLPFIQIEKIADGKTLTEAKQRAEKINYGFKIEGNHLIFDNYFLADVKSKYRGQNVAIYLYLPKGTLLKPDASVEHYEHSNSDFFYSRDESNYAYRVGTDKVECLNCPKDDDDYDDDHSATVTIDEDGVKIKNDTVISNSKEIKELKINENGIIIKTK